MKFKRGSSFLLAGTIKLNGAVQDMTGWSLRCTLRKLVKTASSRVIGDVIAELPISWNNAVLATVTLGDNSDTSAWPLGDAVLDIEATSPGGTKVITETASIEIVERITR